MGFFDRLFGRGQPAASPLPAAREEQEYEQPETGEEPGIEYEISEPEAFQPPIHLSKETFFNTTPPTLADTYVPSKLGPAPSPLTKKNNMEQSTEFLRRKDQYQRLGQEHGNEYASADIKEKEIKIIIAEYKQYLNEDIIQLKREIERYTSIQNGIRGGEAASDITNQLNFMLSIREQKKKEFEDDLKLADNNQGRVSILIDSYEQGFLMGVKKFLNNN